METSSQEKTAFETHCGLYVGLVNAPATFQKLMEVVLAELTRGVCNIYLDDVLVFGRTLEEHIRRLRLGYGLQDSALNQRNVALLTNRLSI